MKETVYNGKSRYRWGREERERKLKSIEERNKNIVYDKYKLPIERFLKINSATMWIHSVRNGASMYKGIVKQDDKRARRQELWSVYQREDIDLVAVASREAKVGLIPGETRFNVSIKVWFISGQPANVGILDFVILARSRNKCIACCNKQTSKRFKFILILELQDYVKHDTICLSSKIIIVKL